ncbi:MAG TPA: carbohydrate kinase [Jiangellaceae bacterium]
MTRQSASIVVAGEALVDLVPDPAPGPSAGRNLFRAVPGGSPANVAVGLARLGAPTHLLARLGTGAFGAVVRGHLDANGVRLDHAVAAAEPTTLAVVSLDDAGHAAYDFYADGTADWGWCDDELPDRLPEGAVALCTGSIAAAREPGASALLRLVRRERARGVASIVLDPNLRPALLPSHAHVVERWEELVTLADVVKVSDEDLAWLVPGSDPADVAERWARSGPALVVLTRGGQGAVAFTDGGGRVAVGARAVDVVDTVGAGDAFTAGLVDSLRLDDVLGGARRDELAGLGADALRRVLDRAARVAAITCSRRGADPPTAAELG